MTTWMNGRQLEEPKLPSGHTPSELARMDPRQAAAIRLANEARSDAEAGPIFSHMAYHMRKSVGREGAALTPEQQNEDIAAFEAADPSTLKPEHAAEANRLAGLLRARGWDAHR